MPFSVAGLGSSFASGLLGGMQSAQKAREDRAWERERGHLETYQNLLKSGEWEPVDPKNARGVEDGGVLRVGNVGLLRQKKRPQAQVDPMEQAKLDNLLSLIQTRGKPQEGATRTVNVPIQKPGEKSALRGVRTDIYDAESGQWIEGEPMLASSEGTPQPQAVKTYIGQDGQPLYVRSNEFPPPGSMPAPTFISESRYGLAQRGVSAETLETEAQEAANRVAKARDMSFIEAKDKTGYVAKQHEEFVEATGELAEKLIKAQAIKDGYAAEEAQEMAIKARQEAVIKARARLPKAQTKGVSEGGNLSKAYNWAVGEWQDILQKRLDEKQRQSSRVKKPMPPKPPNEDVVKKPIPKRPEKKTTKSKPIQGPKFNEKLGTMTY